MTKARENSDYTGLQGDLALKSPVASPVFTGSAHVTSGVNTSTRTFLVDNAHSGGSMYNALGVYVGATDRMVTLSAEYNDSIMAFKTAGAERMRIDNAGVVRFKNNIEDNSHGLMVRSSSVDRDILECKTSTTGGNGLIHFYNPNGIVGYISTSGSSTAYNTSSDYRLKENVTPMSGATAQTKLLKPCNFDWISGGNVNGFLAHELAEVVPEAVTGTKDAMDGDDPVYQGIDQSKLVPLLTATIQELIARIEALEGE